MNLDVHLHGWAMEFVIQFVTQKIVIMMVVIAVVRNLFLYFNIYLDVNITFRENNVYCNGSFNSPHLEIPNHDFQEFRSFFLFCSNLKCFKTIVTEKRNILQNICKLCSWHLKTNFFLSQIDSWPPPQKKVFFLGGVIFSICFFNFYFFVIIFMGLTGLYGAKDISWPIFRPVGHLRPLLASFKN